MIGPRRSDGRQLFAVMDVNAETQEVEAQDHLEMTPAAVEAIRTFLVDQGADPLAERLIALALRDPEVSRELFQWRRLTPPPVAFDELRALVDDILDPGRDYIAWGTAGPYVARAEAVVPLLASVRAPAIRTRRSNWGSRTFRADWCA